MTGDKQVVRSLPAVLASCLALTLAACEVFQPPAAPPPPIETAAPAAAAPAPPPPPRKPTPPGPSLARLTPPSAETGPGGPANEAGPSGFDRLVGLDQPHVADLLGDPRSLADSPPATIWRYVGADCDADIYFYLDLQSQTMRVLHYEIRNHDLSERSAQRCYDALLDERRARADIDAGTDRPR
jgi:hypothetical protein